MTKNYVMNDKKETVQMFIILKLTDSKGAHVFCK